MYQKIKIWIDISKDDLVSSRILYENKKYRNSYFLFQQASEKANKAFALLNKTLSETEAKEINHNQTKIYRNSFIKQQKNISETIDLFKNIEIPESLEVFSQKQLKTYEVSLKNSISFIDSLRNCDLINITENTLNEFIIHIKEIQNFQLELPKNFNTIFKNSILEISKWTQQFETEETKISQKEIHDFLNNKKDSKLIFDSFKTVIYPLMIDIVFISQTLYYCAILTIQHSSLSRYPSDGVNPENIYIKSLPIVNKQIEVIEFLEEAILRMEKINNRKILENQHND